MHRGLGIALALLALSVTAWLVVGGPGPDGEVDADRASATVHGVEGADATSPSGPGLVGSPAAPAPGAPGGQHQGSSTRAAAAPGVNPAAGGAQGGGLLEIKDPAREMIVTVDVRGPDGKVVDGARVTVVQEGYSGKGLAVGGPFRHRINRGRGRLTIEASQPRGPLGELALPYGWARRVVPEADEGPLTIELPRELTITGRVHGPRGEGVADVVLTAVPAWAESTRYSAARYPIESTVRTAQDGSFRLGGLGEGDVLVSATVPAGYLAPVQATWTAGASGVAVALDGAVTPLVTVLGPTGDPVVGAIIYAYADPSPSAVRRPQLGGGVIHGGNNLTDAQGTFRIPSIDPAATYALEVLPPRGRKDLIGVRIKRWEIADTTVRLPSGQTITGVVRGPDGKGVGHANIYFRKGDRWADGNVRADGTFWVEELKPDEEVRIFATVGGGLPDTGESDDRRTTSQVVRAGASDVVLTLDPGADLVVVVDGWPSVRAYTQGHLLGEGLRGGRTTQLDSNVRGGGRLEWHGLEPEGWYTLWLHPEGSDHSLLLRGLRAGGEPVKATLEEGRSITGTLTLPEGAEHAFVGATLPDTPFYVHVARVPAGRFEIRGIPRGTAWTITGVVDVGQRRFVVRSPEPIQAGGSFDLDLAHAKRD